MTATADSTWALQTAFRTALVADSVLLAMLAEGADSILDDVNESAKRPYVTIGDIQTSEWDTNTEVGMELIATLNAWTDRHQVLPGGGEYEGRKPARDIVRRIYDVLHNATLTMTGYNLVNLRFQFSGVTRDDENVYHGFCRFRAVTEPA